MNTPNVGTVASLLGSDKTIHIGNKILKLVCIELIEGGYMEVVDRNTQNTYLISQESWENGLKKVKALFPYTVNGETSQAIVIDTGADVNPVYYFCKKTGKYIIDTLSNENPRIAA